MATYGAIILQNPVFHPNRPSTYHVRHHNVCEKSVTNHGNLARILNANLRPITEVIQHINATARFLCRMSEDCYSGSLLQELAFLPFWIVMSAS